MEVGVLGDLYLSPVLEEKNPWDTVNPTEKKQNNEKHYFCSGLSLTSGQLVPKSPFVFFGLQASYK